MTHDGRDGFSWASVYGASAALALKDLLEGAVAEGRDEITVPELDGVHAMAAELADAMQAAAERAAKAREGQS